MNNLILIFMKLKKLLLLLICSITAVCGFAQGGTFSDNLTWNFDSSTETLTISGTGEMWNFDSSSVPWSGILNQIKQVEIGDQVTSNTNICLSQSCFGKFLHQRHHRKYLTENVGYFRKNGAATNAFS